MSVGKGSAVAVAAFMALAAIGVGVVAVRSRSDGQARDFVNPTQWPAKAPTTIRPWILPGYGDEACPSISQFGNDVFTEIASNGTISFQASTFISDVGFPRDTGLREWRDSVWLSVYEPTLDSGKDINSEDLTAEDQLDRDRWREQILASMSLDGEDNLDTMRVKWPAGFRVKYRGEAWSVSESRDYVVNGKKVELSWEISPSFGIRTVRVPPTWTDSESSAATIKNGAAVVLYFSETESVSDKDADELVALVASAKQQDKACPVGPAERSAPYTARGPR